MSFLDFLQSVATGEHQTNPVLQRVAQQAVATAQGHLSISQDPNAPVGPSMVPGLEGAARGVNLDDLNPVKNVPILGGVTQGLMRAETLPLQLAGLGQEAFGNAARATAGAGTAALGGLDAALQGGAGPVVGAVGQTTPLAPAIQALTLLRAVGPHLGGANPLPTLAAARQAAGAPGNPYERALAAQDASHAASPLQATAGEMAVNPLNFLNPIGEVGAGLRSTRDLVDALGSYVAREPSTAARGVGGLLEAIAGAGHATNAPAEAAFGLAGKGGGFRFGFDPATAVPTAADAGQQFAQQQQQAAQAALAAQPPLTRLFAQNVGYGGQVPGLTTLGTDGARGVMGDWVGRATDPLTADVLLGNGPSQIARPNAQRDLALALLRQPETPPVALPKPVQPLGDLLGAARKSAQPNPLEQLLGAGQRTAAREIAPRQTLADLEAAIPKAPEAGQLPLPEVGTPPLPVAPEAGTLDFGDRAATVKAVANAPASHLNAVLTDLHNAVYPNGQSDFAIPALTGQARQAFRTSFLTDHPSGNAAEPYLDYLLSRVQKDPKAAARLAEINPMLADDVSMVAENPLALTEHKRLVQALFGVGPEGGADVAPAVSALADNAATATDPLAAMRDLIAGESRRVGTQYPPNDPAFYAKRLGIPEADVPDLLGQLEQEGTLGRDHTGALAVKPARKGFLGGMADAAGGGGFGLMPLSTGRVVGGLGGTLVGGGLGFAAPAPDTETRMKRAATGALLGGTLGTGIGSTSRGEALLEEALAGNRAAWESGSRTIVPTGVGNAVSSLRATQKTALMTMPRNITDNAIKQALGGKSPLKYLGDLWAQSKEWTTVLPALRNAGDEQQRMHVMLQSLGPDFADRDPESMARLAVKQGMDYNLDPEDLGTAGAYPPVSAARGAIGALAQPTKLLATGFLTPAAGAAEGLTLAGRAALQNAVLTPADMIGRFAFSLPEYARQLADAAPAFIRKVAASGQATTLLDQEGRFGASLIKDPTLRGEWLAIQQAAEDAGAARALDHMGDFGSHSTFRKITNNAAPGGVWNIGQSQLLARRAAEHPALATGAIRAAQENYRQALAAGHPDEAGTATIDQDTPGLGLLARLTNGGAAGPLHIPLTYSGSPIGPEVFDVPRQLDPYLHPNQKLYDRIKTLTGAAGLGANPVLDMAAYRVGWSDTPHAGASRWAPIGTLAEQLAHAADIPGLGALTENPVADLLNPDAKPGDVLQQIRTGRYLDPAAITAGNELIYERRGTSASDPKNVDLVAELRDPTSDFYREALARGLGARAGGALVGEVIPGHPQAQTATAYAAEGARTALLNLGLPLTRAQIQEIAARPDGGVLLSQLRQAQIDAAKLKDPLLAVQDLSTPAALGQKVFEQWQRENGGLALFPAVYNQLAGREQERLGLVPLGTAMAQQQQYDQQVSGQAYGRPGPYPGMAPVPFDPTPLYDLMRYLNGGR